MVAVRRFTLGGVVRHPTSSYVLAATLVGLGLSSEASAWTDLGGRWETPIRYQLSADNNDGLPADKVKEVVARAFSAWTEPSCVDLQVDEKAWTVPGGALNAADQEHRVVWVPEAEWEGSDKLLALTFNHFDEAGHIVGADMLLNDGFTWVIDKDKGFDLETVVLHEAGHFFGLNHTEDQTAVMVASYQTKQHSLQADDQAGICALYPKAAQARPVGAACEQGSSCESGTCLDAAGERYCSADCGRDPVCPADFYCVNGPTGNFCQKRYPLDVCTPCKTDKECDNGSCVAFDGGHYCLTTCENGCPRNFTCDAGGQRCVPVGGHCDSPLQGRRNQDCYANGSCAEAGLVCANFGGAGSFCLQDCTKTMDCPEGHACESTGQDGGLRLCRRRAADGALCLPEICGQGYNCVRGEVKQPGSERCLKACKQASDCPENHLCDTQRHSCIAQAGFRAIGAVCSHDATCSSGYCRVFVSSGGRCTQPCEADGDCAAGQRCSDGFCEDPEWGKDSGPTPGCACDRTALCEEGCGCDPDCGKASAGCRCLGADAAPATPGLALLALLGLWLGRRRR